jgi:hypothetical protein
MSYAFSKPKNTGDKVQEEIILGTLLEVHEESIVDLWHQNPHWALERKFLLSKIQTS